MDIIDEAKELLRSRKQAYQSVFNPEDVNARIVLKELADFCRADKTTFHTDPRLHAVLEGRREVWLKIQKYLNLTPDEIWELQRRE